MKRILSLLLVFLMLLGAMPAMVFADEATKTVVYTGTDWPYSGYYVSKLTLSGADVAYVDGTDIYLDSKTASDAEITLTVTAGGSSSKKLGINWNDDATNTMTYAAALADGKMSVKIYAYKASGAGVSRNGTKTFNIYTAEPNETPALAEGVNKEVTEEVFYNETYTVDLNKIFTDGDSDTLTFTVSENGAAAKATNAEYSYKNTVPGTYTLKFTATDGKTAETAKPTYEVTLTVKNSETLYDVAVTAPEGTKFYAVNEVKSGAVVKGAELGYENGVVEVPENITRIMWEKEGMICSSADVTADSTLELVEVTFECKDEKENTDEGATVKVTDKDGVVVNGTVKDTFLLATSETVTYTLTPKIAGHNGVTFENQTPAAGKVEAIFTLKNFKVVAPKGSVVSAGVQRGYFAYDFAKEIDIVEDEENVTYRFAPLSGNAFVRVQRPDDSDAVTYWDWKSSKADGKTITVTEEMLFMNDTEDKFDDATIYRNFEKFEMDLGDIYMNINNAGYINLQKGETKGLNMFRNWMAIESYVNAKIATPDFEYEIVNIDGEGEVITITPDSNNTGAATLKAVGEGTAIVLVTYDAMFSDAAASNSNGDGGNGAIYSAIWPDRTGVFVVSVGKDGTEIKNNMTCNGAIFDAEHSPQFYFGDEGAKVSFKPEEGVTVTVNRSTVGEETLSFGEFTNEGVTVAEDGTVTVSGLKTGRHILRFEKDGVYGYQVVTAQQATVEYKDEEGNVLGEGFTVEPGQQITATIKGLTNPAEKFPTKYNYNCQLTYRDQFGKAYANSTGSGVGVYDFSSTPQIITINVPEDVPSGTTLTLNGFCQMGGFSGDSIGSHRSVTYGTASDMAHGTSAGNQLGTLPEIRINVYVAPKAGISLSDEEIEMKAGEETTLTATVVPEDAEITWTTTDPEVATVENGTVKAVKAGEATIKAAITVGEEEASATCIVKVTGHPYEHAFETGSMYTANDRFSYAVEKIKIAGLNGIIVEDQKTDKACLIELDADTDRTKPITIEMTAVGSPNASGTYNSTYLWVNQLKSETTYKVSSTATFTTVPEWNENGEAVFVFAAGSSAKPAQHPENQKPKYTVTLRIHDAHDDFAEAKTDEVKPTCEENGLSSQLECSFCGEVIAEPQEIANTEVIPAVEPTCEAVGSTAGMKCLGCEGTNQECTNNISPVELPNKEELPAVAVTCEAIGYTAGMKCLVCEEAECVNNVEPQEIPNKEELPAVEPTCDTVGWTAGVKCLVCEGTNLECANTVVQEEIPMIPYFDFEVVFDKDEFVEDDYVEAKVYVKKNTEKDLDVNVIGYALSFDENLILKENAVNEALACELSKEGKGIVIRKLRDKENTADIVFGEENVLIDTLTFKAIDSGKVNAEFATVENDVDELGQKGTFVTVFNDGETEIDAYYVTTGEKVSYARNIQDEKAAAAVIDGLIEEIGIVTFSVFEKIGEVRAAYDDAATEVKAYVTKLAVLEKAEEYVLFHKNGDVDVNGKVNAQDLSMILGTYGQGVDAKNACCDVNVEEESIGWINGGDLDIVIGHYGERM